MTALLENSLPKEQVIALATEGSYSKKQVIELISAVKTKDVRKPSVLRKYDVVKFVALNKLRPCVIIKVAKDFVYMLPLTSVESDDNLGHYVERFGQGYIANALVVAKINEAKKNFIYIFENRKAVRLAVDKLKNIVKSF